MLSLASNHDPVLGLFGLSFDWNTQLCREHTWSDSHFISGAELWVVYWHIRGRGEAHSICFHWHMRQHGENVSWSESIHRTRATSCVDKPGYLQIAECCRDSSASFVICPNQIVLCSTCIVTLLVCLQTKVAIRSLDLCVHSAVLCKGNLGHKGSIMVGLFMASSFLHSLQFFQTVSCAMQTISSVSVTSYRPACIVCHDIVFW